MQLRLLGVKGLTVFLCSLYTFGNTQAKAQVAPADSLNAQQQAVPAHGRQAGGSEAVQAARVPLVGVLPAKVQMGQSGPVSGVDVAEAIRQSVIQSMSGPALQAIALTARIPVQSKAEVKEKQCDYVLHTTVTHKPGGGFKRMLKRAEPIAGMVGPIVGIAGGVAGGVAGAVGGAAASTAAHGMSGLAGLMKEKDEITFEYRLMAANGEATLIANTTKAKAKSNGEDVLTPMIEEAAMAIVTALLKK